MTYRNLSVLSIILAFVLPPAIADAPRTFSEAKQAASQLYRDHQTSFYCACPRCEQAR